MARRNYSTNWTGPFVPKEKSTRDWLEETKTIGMSLGLSNTIHLMKLLNIKFDKTKTIHIAGSNGKGTLCAFMAASMTLSGHSNILFSSPHLCRVEERIRFNGCPVDNKSFEFALEEIRSVSQKNELKPTFFETTFLAAMLVAMRKNIEYLILETGLGGRLDATRCAPADLSILTSITREHTDILGENIYQIIREKAAIARPGKPLIARVMQLEKYIETVEDVSANCAIQEMNETFDSADCNFVSIPEEATIMMEARVLAEKAFEILNISVDSFDVVENRLRWPARLQTILLNNNQTIILDAAHNPTGLKKVAPELSKMVKKTMQNGKWSLIFGTSPQNNMDLMLTEISQLCELIGPPEIYLTKPHGGRYPAVETSELASYEWLCTGIHEFDNPAEVLKFLLKRTPKENGTILSIGSLYLQGNILNHLGMSSDEELSLIPKESNGVTHGKGD